jgi:hypothetical protein
MSRPPTTAPPHSHAPRGHAVLRSPQRTVGGASAAGAPASCRQLGPPASRRGHDQRPRLRWCSRSQAARRKAVLAAPAARAATLIAPGSCLPQCASAPGPRCWSVGACPDAGARGPGTWRPVGRGSGAPAATGRLPERHLEDAGSGRDRQGWWAWRGSWSDPRRGRPSHGGDWTCIGPSHRSRFHAPRGNAVLAAPAARAATRRWSVGAGSHAGAWEPEGRAESMSELPHSWAIATIGDRVQPAFRAAKPLIHC